VRPKILDLFCCAGGAATGYHRAGFDVIGVDIEPQPNYPFDFIQGNATAFPLKGFDAIHASPPCQMYSRALKHMSGPQPMLIDVMRERLEQAGVPWIIENVEGSPIPHQSDLMGRHGVMLCGTSFGKRIYRHRLFEASFPLHGLPCKHDGIVPLNPYNKTGRNRIYEEHGRDVPDFPEILWRREMGVEWMGRYEAREAIPPAFTEFLGRQLMAQVDPVEAAA
jgi:DNA (cytosine-5)-methyltransferase 1